MSRYKRAALTLVGSNLVEMDRIKVDAEIVIYRGHLMEASLILIQNADGRYLTEQEVELR